MILLGEGAAPLTLAPTKTPLVQCSPSGLKLLYPTLRLHCFCCFVVTVTVQPTAGPESETGGSVAASTGVLPRGGEAGKVGGAGVPSHHARAVRNSDAPYL